MIDQQPTNFKQFKEFSLGSFRFKRDQYFVTIYYPHGMHIMGIAEFLKAIMRDVAWDFFYGTVNFDRVIGTKNHYGNVDLFLGSNNDSYQRNKKDFKQNFPTAQIKKIFRHMLQDWCHPDFDPFAAPRETISAFTMFDSGTNVYIDRQREIAKRMIGLNGDAPLRLDDEQHPINDHFKDISQQQPDIYPEPGFESTLHATNLLAYLSRSSVTWNPSICSALQDSLFCPTTEEGILPIIHGNDRVEWFIQLTDEITWTVEDGKSGQPRALVHMRPGDVSAMPADIRHQGYAAKRAMLLVWENASPDIADLVTNGQAPVVPVQF